MPAMYDYEELVILRLLELNSLMPHYWAEFMILSFQLINPEEQKILKKKIEEVEKMVLEEDFLFNKYKCLDCNKKFRTRVDWFDLSEGCPKCQSLNIETVRDRHSLYDIEMSMESNRDYNAFFLRYGDKISKFDVERKLIKIKEFVFRLVRERAQSRRFKRFR